MSSESNRQQQRAQWHERIVAQSLSGLAILKFCRQQGLCSKTFYRWKSRLNLVASDRVVAAPARQPKFLALKAPPRAAQRLVLIRLSGGAQISVFDISAIPALLAEIR